MSDEGDDSPPRPKRRIRAVTMLTSSSDSDSDDGVVATTTRRKRLRVVSDEDTDSSGSLIVRNSTRRRTLPPLCDSDGVSDAAPTADGLHDGPATPGASPPGVISRPSAPASSCGFVSDSSEGNSDKCSICLLRFTNQEVGTPETCEHIFCLDCITEWSRNVNTCPVDRITFNSIVVRAFAGGRVLRSEPVRVVERRPSVDVLVIEDTTVCEICGRSDNEEFMLLCDGCDLGYHMQCLTPPLHQVPANRWLCPNCFDLLDVNLSDVDDLIPDIADIEEYIQMAPLLMQRSRAVLDEPSTSSGRRGAPASSRAARPPRAPPRRRSAAAPTAPTAPPARRSRTKTSTVIIEYEEQESGKRPIVKRVKRKVKKRKTRKRQPRTAARRTHVRASVRAKLASMKAEQRLEMTQVASASSGIQDLSARRHRAGIPALSILGNPNQLEYFSEDEDHVISQGSSFAVAMRPTSHILNTMRQTRRKMVTVPSPQHASSAPDILSSILESQTLLHSKNSILSVSIDGNVDIKLETREQKPPKKSSEVTKPNSKVDVLKAEDATRKVPSYPGQSRGGGWGGGYRGNYHREQGTTGFGRGSYSDGNYGGTHQNRPGNSYQNNNLRREDSDTYNNYSRRPHQYLQNDDMPFDRNRRHSDVGRGANHSQHGPHNQRHHDSARYSTGAAPWQPYSPAPTPTLGPALAIQHRHSFGGFENPLDMRTGHLPHQAPGVKAGDGFDDSAQRRDRTQPYRPLPEPPVFNFDKSSEVEKSEDERSDSSLVIDTDKYDPTEPTRDDDSGDEDKVSVSRVEPRASPAPPADTANTAPPVAVVEPMPVEPAQLDVRSALASIDARGLGVPPSVLDSAVRQVLKEHRELLAPATRTRVASDDDSDGDCPNFSIYSATSVHIANNTSVLEPETPTDVPQDNLEDLVQEDDTPTPEPEEPESEPEQQATDVGPSTPPNKHITPDIKIRKKSEEEYKEKVSKRCPITVNTRNPIKIKLNTPSLIKRHMSLYDEEEEENGAGDAALADHGQPSDADSDVTTRQISVADEGNIEFTETYKDEVAADNLEQTKNSDDIPVVETRFDKEEQDGDLTPELRQTQASPEQDRRDEQQQQKDIDGLEELQEPLTEHDENEPNSENELNPDDESESGTLERLGSQSPKKTLVEPNEPNDDALEKMTESISETEDERSYTPCLDENKSKDTSLETEKDKGIEGLDTEMISEDEGNEMFSEEERARSDPSHASPLPRATPVPAHDDLDENKETKQEVEVKKKKKKDSKKEVKDRGKAKRKTDIAFRKLSKNGKERNYRERDKDGVGERERRDSTDSADRDKRKRKRKEKRKDLERYDVRTVVSEKRRKRKDPFGRDVSPHARSRSPSLSRSPPPRRSPSPPRRPLSRLRRSASPARRRRSVTPRASPSPPRAARSPEPRVSPRRRRRDLERSKRVETRRRRSTDRARKRRRSATASKSPRPKSTKRKKRARSERPASRRRSPRRKSPRRRRARRRSASRVAEASPVRAPAPEAAGWSPPSAASRLASPRTPPPAPPAAPAPPADSAAPRRRRDPERARHRRLRDAGGASKEVFTSGDNILVSVSFKEQERDGDEERRERRRERRRRRKRATALEPETGAARPVAIIDLERSPFRELTPSPRNVIVLSDSEPGERESGPAPEPAASEPVGPKTPPEPVAPEVAPAPETEEPRGPNTPPEPPDSPDAYDPYEPTRSASASPSPVLPVSPPRTTMTLETAQKTNMSADEVLDRRPLSPIEKVMALLQSTREVPPDPPPEPSTAAEAAPPAAAPPAPSASAAASGPAPPAALALPPGAAPPPAAAGPPVRIVLPEPTRAPAPKLFLAKPSPIKSDPIKPMQAAKLPRPAPADSPYSPGSSDFGELFEPPGGSMGGGGGGGGSGGGSRRDPFDALAPRPRRKRNAASKVPVKLDRNKGKMQVGVKIDEDNLKILDDLPSSAVEMQVKSKFLKKLNRQERVVEEVKLVLKPHYNKKHVTKEEYKDILRRAVPKICHNKSGEINPTKIQALIEAYVKKIRKKHKLGLV